MLPDDEGTLTDDISAHLTRGGSVSFSPPGPLPTREEMVANSAHLLETLGFPADLAAARARSEFSAPRDPRTADAFESIVREIFVPELKRSGFKKTRNAWTRKRDLLRAVIDIQRGWSTGDLLEFTSNWYVRVDGFVVGSRRDVVIAGRIGDFLGAGGDRWWSIQLGWLVRHSPMVETEPDECRREIAEGLRRTIAWLDEVDTVPRLIAALEPDELPHHFHCGGTSSLFPIESKRDVIAALRNFEHGEATP